MGPGWDYDKTPFAERASLLLRHSTFFVFGTEESYGYLPNDFVRDKDGNAACLMFSELCAWVAGQGLTVPEYLDHLQQHLLEHLALGRGLDVDDAKLPVDQGDDVEGAAKLVDFGNERELELDDLDAVRLAPAHELAEGGRRRESSARLGTASRLLQLGGHILILGSVLAAASYALLARRSTHRAPALVVTTHQLLAATAIAVPYVIVSHLARHTGPPTADLSHWAAGIAAGLAGVALPFLLYNRAIVQVRATIAAGVLNLVPLVGFATAVIFLGDQPTLLEIAGGCLILLSAAWLGRHETRAQSIPQAAGPL